MFRILLLFVFICPLLYGQNSLRYIQNEAFGFGEKLEYKVGYQFVKAGSASFYILPKPAIMKGKSCYDIRFEVKSLQSLDWLYRVKDIYRTVVDVEGIFPHYFEQHVREGNYKRDFTARFDQQAHKAYTQKGVYPIPPFVHDIVSAFYFIRTIDLASKKKNEIIPLKNFFDDTTYALGVKIIGKQKITVEAGTFNCIVLEPLITEGGLFKSEGKILMWVTDDERKLPVKVSTKIIIGSIDAELTQYSGIRGEIKANVIED